MNKRKYIADVACIAGLGSIAIIVASLAFGIANMIVNRNPWKNLWTGIIPTLSGGFGTTFLIYLDKANVLLEYSTWIRRGMP